MEQPKLGLGLLGFAEPVGLRLQEWAAQTPAGWPLWRTCDPHLADAWMIAGDAIEVLGRDEMVIRHPFDSGERLTLNRAEVAKYKRAHPGGSPKRLPTDAESESPQ